MADKTLSTKRLPGPPLGTRLLILSLGIPSVVAWGLLVRFALPLMLHMIVTLPSGVRPGNGGRVLYAFAISSIALIGGISAIWVVWRTYKGRAPLWCTGVTLAFGIVCLMLFGLIGD